MPAHILVVEDEEALCSLLEYNLNQQGFQVSICRTGEEALKFLATEKPDLALLDWMLPHVSGIEICRQIRSHQYLRHLPVILLTARNEIEDRIRGLDLGADDFIAKPFTMEELLARIRALLRRSQPEAFEDVLCFADITLDRGKRRVYRDGVDIQLGPTEFRLLDCLMQRPGRVFSREQLLDLAWGREIYVEPRTVDVHIGRLRKTLSKKGHIDPIRTVRASGYALDETYPQKLAESRASQ